ncbi:MULTISPECIES: cytochrome b [unclassified Luteimonas]
MSLKNTRERWGGVSQALHWLVALLILLQGPLGIVMASLPNSPDKIRLYALHKSIGLTILALATLRLCWRLYAGAPAALADVPGWQQAAARLSHRLLYALLFAIPLSGWLFNSAAGFPMQWFGLFNLPAIASADPALREFAGNLHLWLFWLLVAVTLVHAAAALHHHLIAGHPTLARMLPRGWLHSPDPLDEKNPNA